jgi:hypothetical protein
MPSADQPLKGFAQLLAAIAIVSMATATLRLELETWPKTRSDPKPPSSAMTPTRPAEATSPSSVGDLPPSAVAAIAKTSRPPEPAPLAAASIDTIAIAKRPHEPTLHATAPTREEPDLASSGAAAARAKALVEQSVGVPNAKILEPVVAKRVGDGSSVGRAKRPRYETEVVAEIPRGSGTPIQRRYLLTLQYVGGGAWQVEGMQFATRY